MQLTQRTFRGKCAELVARAVCAPDLKGALQPAGGTGKVLVDDNGQHLTVIVSGEGFECIVGKSSFFQFAVSAQLAGRLLAWMVWWWVVYSWLGVRHRIWTRALNVMYDEARRGA